MSELAAVVTRTDRVVDFGFHVEDGKIVIDACDGISPANGLALFDDWIIEAMLEADKK